MPTDPKELFARKNAFAARKVGNEMVLVPVKGSVADMEEMFTLNEVGAFIYEQLDANATVGSLEQAIVNEFDADSAEVRADLDDFLVQLGSFMLK
jgi:hypothetical protein